MSWERKAGKRPEGPHSALHRERAERKRARRRARRNNVDRWGYR